MCFNRLFVKDIFLALYQGYILLINYKLHLLFHARLHFAYSTIPEGKWKTTRSLLFNSNFILNSTVKPRLMATTLLWPFFFAAWQKPPYIFL